MISAAELERDIVGLGVRDGDLVMVHVSLRAVGVVPDGADRLLAALDAAVGPQGTLLMTLGALDPFAWVNERPESEREALLAAAPVFDAATAPAEVDIGVFAEFFRRAPGTVVSDHPEGRIGARGRLAVELTVDPPWDDYYGPGSTLQRLVQHGGSVLRLGAAPDTVTLTHYAEYLAELPRKRRVRRHRKVAGASGPEVRVIECLDDSDGIVECDVDYFPAVLADYLATGRASVGTVGGARAERLDAADYVAFAAAWMTERLA